MKIGKVILSVAGATAAVCSAFAFKAQKDFNGRQQLFTKSSAPCHIVDAWTAIAGTPAPADKYYTDIQCDVTYTGNVVFED